MEFVTICRALARHKPLIALGALLAILGGLLLAGVLGVGPGSSGAETTAVAASRVQLDFPTAIIVDVTSVHETIPTQAAQISDLVSAEDQRVAIARRAGLPARDVGMVRPQLTQLLALGQLADRASRVAAVPVGKRYTIEVQAAQNLPIVAINVAAPTRGEATRLSRATIEQLRTVAASRGPSPKRALEVIALDPVRAVVVRPPDRWAIYGVIGGVGFFVLWCSALLVLSGLLRAWRSATAAAVAHAASA